MYHLPGSKAKDITDNPKNIEPRFEWLARQWKDLFISNNIAHQKITRLRRRYDKQNNKEDLSVWLKVIAIFVRNRDGK